LSRSNSAEVSCAQAGVQASNEVKDVAEGARFLEAFAEIFAAAAAAEAGGQ
jgi:hypothetical protein